MEHFKIIGIAAETTNQHQQAAKDLARLWQQFYAEEVSDKIPEKESEDVYAVYTDYETDYTGNYTAIIGQRVRNLDNIPEGLIGREVYNEKLMKYVAKGAMPDAVVDTWKEIWANDIALYRTYKADFEVYGQKAQRSEDAEVDIYIGVRM